MSALEPKIPNMKEKLASIVQGFDSFDTEMKIGTRTRREKDEYKIAELKAEMKRLDTDLVAEIKRRTEMNKSTQLWFEQQLLDVNKSFRIVIEERHVSTVARIEEVDVRITELDEHFKREKEEIIDYIDRRGLELTAMLNAFKAEFDEDRKLRVERDEALSKQLAQHEYEVSEKFDKQIRMREARYAAVKAILEENIALREKAEERFQSFFQQEIIKIKNDAQKESEIREREDNEITEALNRYTIKLQSSLKIINSTDM